MPRTLATARGRCPHKAALKARGINPNKLLLSSHIQRMGVTSATSRPRSHEATEKVLKHTLEKAQQEEKAKQEAVEKKGTEEKENRKRTAKTEIRKHQMVTRSMVKKVDVVKEKS